MRYSSSEKYEIIRLVEGSNLPVCKTLRQLNIHKSTFYNWLKRYQEHGIEGLENRKPTSTLAWNQIVRRQRLWDRTEDLREGEFGLIMITL